MPKRNSAPVRGESWRGRSLSASARGRRPSIDLIKGYLFLGGGFVFLAFFIYTNYLIGRLEAQSDTLAGMFARFCAVATVPAAQDREVKRIFEEVMREVRYPVVVTNARGVPWTWKGIGVDLNAVPFEVFAATDPKAPSDPTVKKILEIVEDMDSKHEAIPMRRPGRGEIIGWVHYGDSDLVRELKWVPFVQAGVVATFLFIVLLGYRSVKLSEQRSIWVGMAKETAHQLGTPISSLMGWVEILKERIADDVDCNDVGKRRELLGILAETETDIRRLEKVVSRFSHVGSAPALYPADLIAVLHSSIDYIKRRFPQLGSDIEVRENYDPVPPVRINGELLEWVVENLLKNSLDAIEGAGGVIEVSARYDPDTHRVCVEFKDNGRGIAPAHMRRVFLPGFSTKRRGWGLGLPLSKRIIEEYHDGKLEVVKSAPGEGTIIQMALPIAPIASAERTAEATTIDETYARKVSGI
jgi:two-component system, NtrC family, sensor histidine kinase KinB